MTKYTLSRPGRDRFRWFDDLSKAIAEVVRLNGYRPRASPDDWRVTPIDDDLAVNEYPYSEIPDAMGGSPVALMTDGGMLCEFCVADPTNPVWDSRGHDYAHTDGWAVIGWFNSADTDDMVQCDHCHRILNEGSDIDPD